MKVGYINYLHHTSTFPTMTSNAWPHLREAELLCSAHPGARGRALEPSHSARCPISRNDTLLRFRAQPRYRAEHSHQATGGICCRGLVERRVSDSGDGTPQYLPTEKGLDLKPVIMALTAWGDRWAAPNGPPVLFEHAGCSGHVALLGRYSKCKASPEFSEILATPTKRRTRETRK